MTDLSPKPAGAVPTYRIRPCRRGDADPIGALLVESGYATRPDSATVNWIISHPEMEIFIAADSFDKPVGLVSLSHRPQLRLGGRIATIDELAVTSGWRRRGVGKGLLQRAIERAKVLSVKRLEIAVHPSGVELSRSFLSACGLVEAGAMIFRVPSFEAP